MQQCEHQRHTPVSVGTRRAPEAFSGRSRICRWEGSPIPSPTPIRRYICWCKPSKVDETYYSAQSQPLTGPKKSTSYIPVHEVRRIVIGKGAEVAVPSGMFSPKVCMPTPGCSWGPVQGGSGGASALCCVRFRILL